jgi:hypothetical protein
MDGTFTGSGRKTVNVFPVDSLDNQLKIIFRLEIQAKLRQVGRNPNNTDRQTIETTREQLAGLLQELKSAMNLAGVVEIIGPTCFRQEPLALWDDILHEPVPTGTNSIPPVPTGTSSTPPVTHGPALNISQSSNDPIQIEHQRIPLPSNGNIGPEYAELELSHRVSHADHHLNRIRDLIAEKSFQYSHVIRVSPRKGVNTQSRGAVRKLNLQISIHCRLYTQCRSSLLKLGADPVTMNRFQTLTIDDVKASTAIVNPNEPGSTRIKLSWIWQSAGGHRLGLASGTPGTANGNSVPETNILECRYIFSLFFTELTRISQFAVFIGFGPVLNL